VLKCQGFNVNILTHEYQYSTTRDNIMQYLL